MNVPFPHRNTILKVKETRNIILPGCFSSDGVAIVAETPFSEMSMVKISLLFNFEI